MRTRRLSLVLALSCFALPAAAQQPVQTPSVPSAAPRTIVGIVNDTAGKPMDSVEVFLQPAKRRTLTKADGTFRFDDVQPGAYQVSARHIGFFPQVHPVRVGAAGGTVRFSLVRSAYGLPAVVTVSTRPGLSGVVGDTAYNIVAGAEISVLASDRRTKSDSTGAFYLDIKPGTHVLHVAREGFAPQMISVTIPADSGRRMVVWLTPSNGRSAVRDAALMDALQTRLLVRNPVWSTIWSREDISKSGIDESSQLASIAAKKRVDERCDVIVDGVRKTQLWTLTPADVEMMEVYTTPRERPTTAGNVAKVFGRGGPDNRGVAPTKMSNDDCGATIYVWLRK